MYIFFTALSETKLDPADGMENKPGCPLLFLQGEKIKTLIVIDVQNDYFPRGAFPLENAAADCINVLTAIEYPRLHNWLIVVSAPDAPFFSPESEDVRLHLHAAQDLGDAPVIRKG